MCIEDTICKNIYEIVEKLLDSFIVKSVKIYCFYDGELHDTGCNVTIVDKQMISMDNKYYSFLHGENSFKELKDYFESVSRDEKYTKTVELCKTIAEKLRMYTIMKDNKIRITVEIGD